MTESGPAALNQQAASRSARKPVAKCSKRTGPDLTKREAAALALYPPNGELNEGLMSLELWPLIRNPRLVTNSLVRKGLVTLGQWWDEETGYELHLTEEGRAALREERH